MLTFLFRCPHTGLRVQAWSDNASENDQTYEMVNCIACLGVHLVNPKSGQVVGNDNDE